MHDTDAKLTFVNFVLVEGNAQSRFAPIIYHAKRALNASRHPCHEMFGHYAKRCHRALSTIRHVLGKQELACDRVCLMSDWLSCRIRP